MRFRDLIDGAWYPRHRTYSLLRDHWGMHFVDVIGSGTLQDRT